MLHWLRQQRWLRWVKSFVCHLRELDLQIYAANASFFLLISAFPAVMLLMTLLKFLPLDAASMLRMTQGFLPAATQGLAEYLIAELYDSSTGTVISLSVVVALWSASRGVLAMLAGVNAAYTTDDTRGWLHRRLLSILYTVALLLALVLTLALQTYGQSLQGVLTHTVPEVGAVFAGIMPLRTIIVLAALVGFFLVIYTVFPDRKMRLLRQLPGAVLASVGWIGFSAVYSLYIERFSNMNKLYGSLTAVVVTMLWLYFCMCIVFFGAALNEQLELYRQQKVTI